MSIAPVGSSPNVNIYTPPAPGYIRIDGKDYPYTPPTAKLGADGTWSSVAGAGMTELAKTVNEQTSQAMDGDTFMKLLVAQMKYQDPSKPMDTGEMMQQTASMSMVQRINEMATNINAMVEATKSLSQTEATMGKSYAQMLVQQQMSSAVGLVGRTISYADATNPDTKVDGVVDSVRFDQNGPILSVNGKDVPLSSVSSVKSAATTTSPSSTTTGTPSTTA